MNRQAHGRRENVPNNMLFDAAVRLCAGTSSQEEVSMFRWPERRG